jgi:hypothetical protein
MFLPHRDDGFPKCLPAQVGAKPVVPLVGDVGEEVAATGQVQTAIVGLESAAFRVPGCW